MALAREATIRMVVLREHGYNRVRARDTIDFLRMALLLCRSEDADAIRGYMKEAQGLLEEESYLGAKFYDSTTRTKRSAVNAYEQFLREYPESVHADEVKSRIEVLKEDVK